MADELDIAYDSTSLVMGSTDVTVDQGGSGGSDAIQTDGWPMRRVAAEARRVLLELASTRFGVPVGQLAVSRRRDLGGGRSVAEGHLRRADRRQAVQRHADRQQHRRDHRRGQGQDGAGAQDRRQVAAALRHPRQGGRLAEVGRRRQGSRHGARAQREAAGRRRASSSASTSRPFSDSRDSSRWSARATTWRSSASARSRRFSAARQLKVNWQKPATAPFPASEDLFTYMRERHAHVEPAAGGRRQRRDGARGRGEGHRGRLRGPVPGAHGASVRPMPWPIRRTVR